MTAKAMIEGDWSPIPKFIRNHIIEYGITWRSLESATSIGISTLASSFRGTHKPPFETIERVANALGFHLVLVPMTDEEQLTLEAGTYESPICMERKELQ